MGASYKDKVGLVPMSADILDWYINGGGGGGGRLKEGSPALTCAGWLTSHHLHHLNIKHHSSHLTSSLLSQKIKKTQKQ